MAQEETGGDLFLIETVEKYPSDYDETTNVAAEEQSGLRIPEFWNNEVSNNAKENADCILLHF